MVLLKSLYFISKGPITWSIFNPGVEFSPVDRVEIFCDYMDDFNPSVETLYYTFSASIRGSKKAFILFSCFLFFFHYHACSNSGVTEEEGALRHILCGGPVVIV
jgi:hypothetical protein